jgi:hypothetical protein
MMRAFMTTAVLVAAAPVVAEPIQAEILAFARTISETDFAFTRTVRAEQRAKSGESETTTVVERFDPTKPPAQRWTLVSVNGRAPTDEEKADAAKRGSGGFVPSYGRIARWVGAPAVRTQEGGRTAFRFAKLPKGTMQGNGPDISANLGALAVLGEGGTRPWIERVKLSSVKPFRMMMVAKVERMTFDTRYRLMPDGRPVIAEQSSETVGSMMGRSGSQRSVTTFSDYRAIK